MLSDDVAEKGYALLCMAVPQTDCKITTVSEVGVAQVGMLWLVLRMGVGVLLCGSCSQQPIGQGAVGEAATATAAKQQS